MRVIMFPSGAGTRCLAAFQLVFRVRGMHCLWERLPPVPLNDSHTTQWLIGAGGLGTGRDVFFQWA